LNQLFITIRVHSSNQRTNVTVECKKRGCGGFMKRVSAPSQIGDITIHNRLVTSQLLGSIF